MKVHGLNIFPPLIEQGYLYIIEVGVIAAPTVDMRHFDPCRRALAFHRQAFHFAALGIGEEDGRLEVVAQFEIDVERAVFVVVCQSGGQTDVLDMFHGTGVEIALACYSCETEEVLVLKVTAIAPTHDLEGDEVGLTRFDEACQVKLTS